MTSGQLKLKTLNDNPYFKTLEEALKRAKAAGKRPGCHFGGIVLKSGKKGFAIYR